MTYGLGTENQDLPAFVVMVDHRGGPVSGPAELVSGVHAGHLSGHPVPFHRGPDSLP